jgi:hypothetical protein
MLSRRRFLKCLGSGLFVAAAPPIIFDVGKNAGRYPRIYARPVFTVRDALMGATLIGEIAIPKLQEYLDLYERRGQLDLNLYDTVKVFDAARGGLCR